MAGRTGPDLREEASPMLKTDGRALPVEEERRRRWGFVSRLGARSNEERKGLS